MARRFLRRRLRERGASPRPCAAHLPRRRARRRGATGHLAMEAMSTSVHSAVLRQLYPRVLAKTLGLTRALPDAEDAVHDALERALKSWPESGAPDSPEAWLVTVAANAHR